MSTQAEEALSAETVTSIEPSAGQDKDDLLRLILEATAPLTGDDYFSSLVQRLAQSLQVDVALVTECLDYPENHVRTLAFWHDDDFIENLEFDVIGTPCEDVLGDGRFCYYPAGMGERYPDWAAHEGGVESFIGIPIHAPSSQRIIGHIAAYHRRAVCDERVVESVFRVIAARAGAELQRMQAERALRDAEERSRQHLHELAHLSRLHSMGEMASALTHEIKQPLTSILCSCSTLLRVLERGDAEPALLRENIERAQRSARNVNEIVRSLGQYARKAEPRREPMRLEGVLERAIELFRSEARANRIRIDLVTATALPLVDIDRVLVPQVLMNLLRNAVDAINAAEAPDRTIRIHAYPRADDHAIVEVRDGGDGISGEIAAHLFEPFHSNKSDGMGIGLSLSRSLIADQGGTLWLERAAGPTTFAFTLPVARP